MSLYHEAAEALLAPSTSGGLKSRIFGKKTLKSPPALVYKTALESCKWSGVLKEVVENSELLRHERKLTPVLALVLVHDFLTNKDGILLPQSHGLRAAVERHKARLTAEFTRARVRRRMASVDALRALVEEESRPEEANYPRWVRVNALSAELEETIKTVFGDFERVLTVEEVVNSSEKSLYLDEHVPYLVALSPGTDVTKTAAYRTGDVILQDKASCFPAYLLDPRSEDGDVIDACAAPGNKTTHLAAIMKSHCPEIENMTQKIFAFEKDASRAMTLSRMVELAGSKKFTRIALGQDFLKVDPNSVAYSKVGALLLDPSCSGSGIVGRDSMPTLHLPEGPAPSSGSKNQKTQEKAKTTSKKRKREEEQLPKPAILDDDGNETAGSEQELEARLRALSAFQLKLVLHAFKFPSAKKITYSTCSIHAEENEHVVVQALASDIAKERGWRILPRDKQVRGMRDWPVRGDVEAAGGDADIAEACIRSYKGDGRGVMGFFVAGFVRDAGEAVAEDSDGPYVRDEDGQIIRDILGMPILKATGEHVSLALDKASPEEETESESESEGNEDEDEETEGSEDEGSGGEGGQESHEVDQREDGEEEWGGFDD